jgi:hypothetical protein
MCLPDPDVSIPDPDPTTATKEEVKNLFSPTLFCSHNYNNTQNYFFTGKEINLSQFTQNYCPFTQKTKIWVQVSGKRPIPDSGPRG